MSSRGDESVEPLRFADDDDDAEIGGFTRGKRSYDEDEDEDGGWALNEDHSSRLWDSADDVDDEDADEEGATVAEDDSDDEEEEADLFGASPVRGRRGRPKGSGKKQEQPSVFSGAADIFSDTPAAPATGPGPTGSSSATRASTMSAKAAQAPAPAKSTAKSSAKSAAPTGKTNVASSGVTPRKPAGKSKGVAAKGSLRKQSPGKSAAKKKSGSRSPARSKPASRKGRSGSPGKGGKKSGRRR